MSNVPTDETPVQSEESSAATPGWRDRLETWSRLIVERTRASAAAARSLGEQASKRTRAAAGEARQRQEAFRLRRERARCCERIGRLVASRPDAPVAKTLAEESPESQGVLARITVIDERLVELAAAARRQPDER